jgi:hypothetical protein
MLLPSRCLKFPLHVHDNYEEEIIGGFDVNIFSWHESCGMLTYSYIMEEIIEAFAVKIVGRSEPIRPMDVFREFKPINQARTTC